MQLKKLSDQQILSATKNLVQAERLQLTVILNHLKEVARRKLFCDLGYRSLFEYCVKELKYSEGQAGRRLQALKLIKELPAVESKISDGSLSLSNISQVQSFTRNLKILQPEKLFSHKDKAELVKLVENKSAREAQVILATKHPVANLPQEKQRCINSEYKEVKLVLDKKTLEQLENVRSLLGINGANLSMAELIKKMAEITSHSLQEKKFGKKRTRQLGKDANNILNNKNSPINRLKIKAKDLEIKTKNHSDTNKIRVKNRYISSALHFEIWMRDSSKCKLCGGKTNLNIDHIHPVAMGGKTELSNLRLLCFSCNQRQSYKLFGVFKPKLSMAEQTS